MKRRALALAAVLAVAACSKVTPENFSRIGTGMTEDEVRAILGSPSQSSSTSVLGLSGTSSKWVGRDAVVTIGFVNGKVVLKDFEKTPRP